MTHNTNTSDKELVKAIVHYRVTCDVAWSERNDGVFTQQEYQDVIEAHLQVLVNHIAKSRSQAIENFRADLLRKVPQLPKCEFGCDDCNLAKKAVDQFIKVIKSAGLGSE